MFVVFEGIDGSGKTTVSNLMVERLRGQGLAVKHLRAEGKFVSSVAEAIRSLARDSKNLALDPRAEFLLYVARDVQLIEEALRDALRTHDVVIADRFLFTAEVLGRYGRNLPESYTRPILEAAAGGLSPDLVLLIDVDPVLARARRKSSKLVNKDARPPSRKGLSGVGLQHRLRRGYLELAHERRDHWFVANNEEQLESCVNTVSTLVRGAIAQGVPAALLAERGAQAVTRQEPRAIGTPEEALRALRVWLDARASREPQVAAYMLSGLAGEQVDDLRRQLAPKVPTVVLAGLTGLLDEVSWELRESLCDAHPAEVARSLAGVPFSHPRAARLRPKLAERAPVELLKSLARVADEGAWELRDQLFEQYAEAALCSLAWLEGERADIMRERWFARVRPQLADHYELARVAARSVHSVDVELAGTLRDAARAAAPIASLASLGSLTSEPSWQQRERSLRRATKVVMETLRRLPDERAFRMRWEVANETKEALDSVALLDDQEAWKLREAYRDVWPSTVVKTLGPLADGERGRELVRRQLGAHPHNVSLLKHAAGIALGVHRAGTADELGVGGA
jgi:dTMP kinase